MALSGNGVLRAVIKLKQGHLGGSSSSMTSIIIPRGKVDTEIRIEDAYTVRKHLLQAKERGLAQIPPSQPSKATNPADTLISGFRPPEL